MPMRRLTAVLLLSLFAAACTGDGDDAEPRIDTDADAEGMSGEEREATPAESAAAVRAGQRHADSVRRAVMQASGVPQEREARTRLPRDLPKDDYESCVRQARDADEPVKSRLEQICENLRNRPKG